MKRIKKTLSIILVIGIINSSIAPIGTTKENNKKLAPIMRIANNQVEDRYIIKALFQYWVEEGTAKLLEKAQDTVTTINNREIKIYFETAKEIQGIGKEIQVEMGDKKYYIIMVEQEGDIEIVISEESRAKKYQEIIGKKELLIVEQTDKRIQTAKEFLEKIGFKKLKERLKTLVEKKKIFQAEGDILVLGGIGIDSRKDEQDETYSIILQLLYMNAEKIEDVPIEKIKEEFESYQENKKAYKIATELEITIAEIDNRLKEKVIANETGITIPYYDKAPKMIDVSRVTLEMCKEKGVIEDIELIFRHVAIDTYMEWLKGKMDERNLTKDKEKILAIMEKERDRVWGALKDVLEYNKETIKTIEDFIEYIEGKGAKIPDDLKKTNKEIPGLTIEIKQFDKAGLFPTAATKIRETGERIIEINENFVKVMYLFADVGIRNPQYATVVKSGMRYDENEKGGGRYSK